MGYATPSSLWRHLLSAGPEALEGGPFLQVPQAFETMIGGGHCCTGQLCSCIHKTVM